MRILLLGANGQIGFELYRALRPWHELSVSTRSGAFGALPCARLEQEHTGACAELIAAVKPELIINAAAYTAVDQAEREPELAMQINAHAVGEIGEAASRIDAKVVHYSTDYVFDGMSSKPYREHDPCDPSSVYGKTKRAGELALAASGARHLILRTQWIYASRGKNFLRTMLRLGAEGKSLKVVDDQFGAPTPAAWVASATVHLMRQAEGLLHISAAGQCSWFEFAKSIFELSGLAPTITPINTAAYGAPAPRPSYGVLDGSRATQEFGLSLQAWQHGLEQTLLELRAEG
jgi:dTDP-4-dehydrorhamnose reductase